MHRMDSLDSELQQWRMMPVTVANVSSIKTDQGLQPRNPKVTRAKDADREKREAEKHIDRLRGMLADDPAAELEPILVAMIDGRRYVVDGHHRLNAYRRAMRKTMLVRERTMAQAHAALLSRLVNLDGTKLPMTTGQCSEAAWQFLATVTSRGRFSPRDAALSTRKVAARFGIASPQTVANMVNRLEAVRGEVEGNLFSAEACDPVTGWPLWKYARGQGAEAWKDVDPNSREQAKVERCARKLAKLREEFGPDILERAETMLRNEGGEDDDEQQGEPADVV